jgi:hypothetical protein
MANCEERALRWLLYTPSYVLPDVSLDDLHLRSTNSSADMDLANDIISHMREWPADACSGRWFDRDGKLMVAVFAEHIDTVSTCTCHNFNDFKYANRKQILWILMSIKSFLFTYFFHNLNLKNLSRAILKSFMKLAPTLQLVAR